MSDFIYNNDKNASEAFGSLIESGANSCFEDSFKLLQVAATEKGLGKPKKLKFLSYIIKKGLQFGTFKEFFDIYK
jgi:hypothetical protein